MGLCAIGVCAPARAGWNAVYERELGDYGCDATGSGGDILELVCEVAVVSSFGG